MHVALAGDNRNSLPRYGHDSDCFEIVKTEEIYRET